MARWPASPTRTSICAPARGWASRLQDCVVVEDSFAGIASANAAKVGAIIAITATNPAGALANLPGVKAVIDDYRDFVSVFDSLCVNRAARPRVS